MRKRTVRKHYKLINPIEYAIKGATLLDQKELQSLRILELSSLESISKGTGSKEDWQCLVNVLNLTQIMAENGIGPEAMEACLKAQDALEEAQKKYSNLGRVVLTGPGIQACRDMLEYAALQQSSIDRSTFERMIQKTLNLIQSKGKKVKVLS